MYIHRQSQHIYIIDIKLYHKGINMIINYEEITTLKDKIVECEREIIQNNKTLESSLEDDTMSANTSILKRIFKNIN